MNTTEHDEALTEQIARVLNDEGWTYEGVHEPGDYDTCGDCKRAVDPVAAAVLPIIRKAQAEAWDEAIRHSIDCANETTDSWGNMYRLDWIARMEHEIEENPHRDKESR